MVSSKLLNNSPINVEDFTTSHSIFGPDLAGVRVKTVVHKPDRVETYLIQIRRDFCEIHKFVTVTSDVMFVNSEAFLTTFSSKIRFLTVEHISFCTAAQTGIFLTKIVKIYARVGFTVKLFLMDMGFEKGPDDM